MIDSTKPQKPSISLRVKSIILMLLIGVLPLLFYGVISLISVNLALKEQAIEFQTELIEQKAKHISLIMHDAESLNAYGTEEIYSVLKQTTPIDDHESYTIILDSKGNVIYHPNENMVGKSLYDSINEALKDTNGVFVMRVNGTETLVVHTRVENTDWTIASLIPVKSIVAKTNTLQIVFSSLLVISLLMFVFFGRIITKTIVHPIQKVIHTFRELRSGNLECAERLKVKSKDEIGELGHLFNSFIDAREDITLQKKLERQMNRQNSELQEALEKLKNTQMQMLQQEKLAAIGQLAAGVAHEINNPLGYVSGNADMLKVFLQKYENLLIEVNKIRIADRSRQDFVRTESCIHIDQAWQDNKIDMVLANTQDMMDDITQGLRRISDIVNGLRGFSRSSLMEEKTIFDINEGIKTTLVVVNNEIKYHCDVELHLGDVPPIYANGGQINQVLLNIILNAAHAIREKFNREKGKLIIKTYSEDDFVICSICDNGSGMTEQVKNRIFEPFFTTKPVGQGTGLGLGIVYDIIVNQHGGSIKVQSESGEGSCFYISLPASENEGAQS